MSHPPSSRDLRHSRLKLLLIVLVFIAPICVAALLTLINWQPSGKGYGLPIFPQRNFVAESLRVQMSDDGRPWAWRDREPRLTLIALAGTSCAARCVETLTKLAAARIALNRNAERLRLLYIGVPPAAAASNGMHHYWRLGSDVDGKLALYRPDAPDSVAAVLVESDGTALSRYRAGFDPTGLRKDLQKVIH